MRRFHLNNKGFAMAGIVYPLLILFVTLLVATLGILGSRKVLLDRTKKEVNREINESNTFEYIHDGLVGHFEGYVGPEKQGDKYVWKDLSGKKNHGEMIGFDYTQAYQQGALTFTGKEYVKLPQIEYHQVTFEAVVRPTTTDHMQVVCNYEFGGSALSYFGDSMSFDFQPYINDTPIRVTTDQNRNPQTRNKELRYLSGSYDNAKLVLYQDGIKIERDVVGEIRPPKNNTIMMIGANPEGSNPKDDYFHGQIYSVRIYNRALSDEEIMHNYRVDKKRFQMFE